MSVKIEFKTGNAAFEDPEEISRILREIADKIDGGVRSSSIHDANGANVGKFVVKG